MKKTLLYSCCLALSFGAVSVLADEVSGELELTKDTVLTNLVGNGRITAASPVTLTLYNTEQQIFKGTIDGAIRIVKTGTGQFRWECMDVSTYTGGVDIQQGIFSIYYQCLGPGAVTVSGGGSLVFMRGVTLTNQVTISGAGALGVWRGNTLKFDRIPDMRQATVTFSDGGTFNFPSPLTSATAGETVFKVAAGILSLPEAAFGSGDDLLVSSITLENRDASDFPCRLEGRGTVTLPDVTIAGSRDALFGVAPVVSIPDKTQGDPRELEPPPTFLLNGRLTVTGDQVLQNVTLGLSTGSRRTEIAVPGGKTLTLSNAVVQTQGATPGGLVKSGDGTLAFHDIIDISDILDVQGGSVAFGSGAQTSASTVLGLAKPRHVVRLEDGARVSARLVVSANVHTGFLATAGIWFDAASLNGADGAQVNSAPNYGTAGGEFSNVFAFGRTGGAPTFSAAGFGGKPALAFNGSQSLYLDTFTNLADQITVFAAIQADSWYPSADGRGLWCGFFSMLAPDASFLDVYSEDDSAAGALFTSFAQQFDDTYDTIEKAFSRLSVSCGTSGYVYTLDAGGRLPIGAPILFTHRREGNAHAGSLYWSEDETEATASSSASRPDFNVRAFSLGGRMTRAGQPNNGRCFTGKIGEMLVFDRALTPSETAFVQAYLKNKWFGTSIEITLETEAVPPETARKLVLDVSDGEATFAAKGAEGGSFALSKIGAGRLDFSDADGAAETMTVEAGGLGIATLGPRGDGKAVIWVDASRPETMTLDAAGNVVAARNLGSAGGAFELSTTSGGVPYLTDGTGINGRNVLAFDNQSALLLSSYTNNNGAARNLHLYGVFQRNGMKQKWSGPVTFYCDGDMSSDEAVSGNFHIEDTSATEVSLFFGGSGGTSLNVLRGENLVTDGEPFVFVSHQGATWTANAFIGQSLDDLAATPWLAECNTSLTPPRITYCQLGGRMKGGVPHDGRPGTDKRLWAGWIGEFIVFDRQLQRMEEVALLDYLRKKWLGKGDGSENPPPCLGGAETSEGTHAGLSLECRPGTTLYAGRANQPLAALALNNAAVVQEAAGDDGKGPLFALAEGASLSGSLSFTTAAFPSGGVTFFTYGTSVTGTPDWTFSGDRADVIAARNDPVAKTYSFAPPKGCVVFIR